MQIRCEHPLSEDFTPTDESLYVVSCGYEENNPIHIQRPQGRNDYHLIYIVQGTGEFLIDGTPCTVPEGQCVIYRPSEPHAYTFSAHAPLRRYWIHFSGTEAERYMTDLGLHLLHRLTVSDSTPIETCFDDIIQEMAIRDKHYIKGSTGHLLRLLTLLSRNSDATSKQHLASYQRFKEVVYHLHTHYADNATVQTYAAMCHLSKYRFIVNFKAFTGYTPIDYRNKVRIDHARRMLLESDMPLYAIADQLGFHSATYFSTVFRHFAGCSPREYRQKAASPTLYVRVDEKT